MLTARPIELRDANDFVGRLHRHHDPVLRDKCRVAAYDGDKLVGVVQLARPVSRMLDDGQTIEVVRLCTDGTHNACSFLYGRAARTARELATPKLLPTYLPPRTGPACGPPAGTRRPTPREGAGIAPAARGRLRHR